MKFGVFEHMDAAGVPLGRQYRERLELIEAYDRLGFHAYHLAEHHGTSLGLAPSPGVFLAAAAERTRRLRLGPLVYSLPLYHPVRLIEEICMLDQLSGGRFELGVGRGVSPIEVGFYGVDHAAGPRQFPEALRCILQGLTSEELTFSGEFYAFERVPMVLEPLQKPHPPLWYGAAQPEGAYWAAWERAHCVTLVPTEPARAILERYRAAWESFGRAGEPLPLLGVQRHVVLADDEREARRTAQHGYARWLEHMRLLWDRHGLDFPLPLPRDVAPWIEAGGAFAGTAAGFRDFVAQQIEATGATYFVCDVAFGDLSLDEALRTTELIGRDVMPAFAD